MPQARQGRGQRGEAVARRAHEGAHAQGGGAHGIAPDSLRSAATDPAAPRTGKKSFPGGPAERVLKLLEQGKKPPTSESYPIAVWAFGDDLAMVFLPNEVVVDYALRMKREMDGRRLWINAYTNDVSYYVVSDRLVKEGGYEVTNSLSSLCPMASRTRFRATVEERIIEGVRRLLPEGFRK